MILSYGVLTWARFYCYVLVTLISPQKGKTNLNPVHQGHVSLALSYDDT